jgi:lipopolysaccharide/colanic/teichoic acid biosynthesis glycosyltransferase
MNFNIFLTTSKVLTLDLDRPITQEQPLLSCSLKWKQEKLLVKKEQNLIPLPALKHQQWLKNCLKYSSVRQVCVDSTLGEARVKLWADACKEANKQIFLRIPSSLMIFNLKKQISWKIKRIFDWIGAAVLLILLSPVMLTIALAIAIFSPGPIFFRQWRVGKRGKLFEIYKFRTMIVDADKQHHEVMGVQNGLHKREDDPRITPIGSFLRKYSLDELPQLLNVLKGDISLVGPRPWALYDALRLGKAGNSRLNALPGITGAWQVEGRANLLELNAVTKCDLDYLERWSLSRDLKILLMTIPKVLSGFGAY